MDSKFKVSLYIRVSTDRQAKEGESLEEQEKELKKLCEFKGYSIHKIHIEAGRSAKDTNRPEYQQLMKDIESEKINAVIVKKLDRLSRSLLDFEKFMVMAQDHNVEFISLRDNFDTTTAMGKAMLRVALVFAQLEREQTAERISDVMNYRAGQGLRNGGPVPYGYDVVNKELVPHKQEKKTLELIFNKFIETKSTVTLAHSLNEAGYRNREGQLWDCRRLHKMLHNPVYKGQMLWGKQVFESVHQALVSDDKFETVQYILSRRKHLSGNSKTNALLQRLLFCGDCHSPMSPSHSLNWKKEKYFYYRCTSTNSHKGKSKCKFRYTSFDTIESRVIAILLSLSEEVPFKLLENRIFKHNQTIERQIQETKDMLAGCEKNLENIKTKKYHYLDSLITNKFLSSERQRINEKLAELDAEEKQAKSGIYKYQLELNQKQDELIDLSAVKGTLIDFKKDHEGFSRDQLREYLNRQIQEIIYYPDKLSIRFRLLPWAVEFEG
jgi:site-specific DNA recombinase